MTDNLHARLLAAVQQRMDVARAAAERPGAHWTLKRYDEVDEYSDGVTGNLAGVIGSGDVMVPEGLHIAANDPATVLRHCEAVLELLREYDEARAFYERPENRHQPAGEVHGLWTAVKLLAAAYGIEVDG